MTSQAGIAPDDKRPAGVRDLPGLSVRRCTDGAPTADAIYDLERMLDVLRSLPDLYRLRDSADAYLGPTAEPIEIALELELDAAAPHVDVVRQLARQIERVLAHRGVVVGGVLVELLERVAMQPRRKLSPLPLGEG